MPIKLPLTTTIRSSDFREHTFSFPVESVLTPRQSDGLLTICASAGYLLTTAADQVPASELTLAYVAQPNGNRLVKSTVTVLATDKSIPAGTITVENPAGELVTLTVDPSPAMVPADQTPILAVSTPALDFGKTAPGKAIHRVFTITQQHADTPVTISTDAPEIFQLASDQRPNFAPGLTLTPSPAGTYVHIRYTPAGRGKIDALLQIETPYTKKYIDLEVQGSGWLPVKSTVPVVAQPKSARSIGPYSPTRWFWLSQLLIGALVLGGYQFRCQLLPSLCQETAQSSADPAEQPQLRPAPTVALARDDQKFTSPDALSARKTARARVPQSAQNDSVNAVTVSEESAPLITPGTEKAEEPASASAVSTTVRIQPNRRLQTRRSDDTLADQPRRRPAVVPTGESELEQELNKKPKNQ